jgi:heptosyltransferase III
MRKILVLRGGALGDFIVTLPTLAVLRRRWPDSHVELVGNATAAELGRREGLIDAVHSQHEARWNGLYGTGALPPELARWLAEFDLVVSYWPDPEGEIHARFPLRPGQVFLSGAALPTQAPAAAHYGEALRALGLPLATEDCFYRLRRIVSPDPSAGRAGIAIHPGSGSPRKNWPMARWRSLCQWLREESGAEILVIAGEAESAAKSSAELADFGRMANGLPLAELATRLAECRLFLGHDSGVSHLAAACGVPCVLLFGPTDPAMWAPPAPHVRVLWAGAEVDSISLADVRTAVTAALADRR